MIELLMNQNDPKQLHSNASSLSNFPLNTPRVGVKKKGGKLALQVIWGLSFRQCFIVVLKFYGSLKGSVYEIVAALNFYTSKHTNFTGMKIISFFHWEPNHHR